MVRGCTYQGGTRQAVVCANGKERHRRSIASITELGKKAWGNQNCGSIVSSLNSGFPLPCFCRLLAAIGLLTTSRSHENTMPKLLTFAAVSAVITAATIGAASWASGPDRWIAAVVPAYAAAPPAPTGRTTKITVYDLPNYKGRTLEFERSVPSLAALDFNDRIASVQIKGPRDWVLCEHRNFMGKCARIRSKANSLKRFKLDGKVSSLYPVPDAPPKHR